MPHFNLLRTYQATFLLPYIQQAALANPKPGKRGDKPGINAYDSKDHRALHAHRVLEALGRRMAGEPKPGVKRNPLTIPDTCLPSLLTVCRETCLSDSTVREALDNLIEWGFITKSRIPGHKLRKGKGQNKYEGNRYHLMPEVWDQVDSLFDPRKKKGKSSPAPASVPTSPATLAADAAIADTLGEEAEIVDFSSPSGKYARTDDILTLLKTHFGTHPSFAAPDAEHFMRGCVRNCIDAAESGDEAFNALNCVCVNPDKAELRADILKKERLGGYIKKAFAETWLFEWKQLTEKNLAAFDDHLDFLCTAPPLPDGRLAGGTYLAHVGPLGSNFCAWLKSEVGHHLLDLGLTEDENGAKTIRPRINETFKAIRIRERGLNAITDAVVDGLDSSDDDEDEDFEPDPDAYC